MNKEKQIASIKQRIIDEHRKHKSIDWAEIAARKIYSTHLVKEKCNLPVVSGSSEQLTTEIMCEHEYYNTYFVNEDHIPFEPDERKCIRCGKVDNDI